MNVGIVGAPCSGKTSVLKELEKGLQHTDIIYEFAREYLERFETIKDSTDQLYISSMQKYREEESRRKRRNFITEAPVFVGEVYGIVYFPAKFSTDYKNFDSDKYQYDKLFLMERLPCFYQDGVRYQSIKEWKFLDKTLRRAAKHFSPELIEVPYMSLEDRVAFIKENMGDIDEIKYRT